MQNLLVKKMTWEREPANTPVVRASAGQDSSVLIFASRNASLYLWKNLGYLVLTVEG